VRTFFFIVIFHFLTLISSSAKSFEGVDISWAENGWDKDGKYSVTIFVESGFWRAGRVSFFYYALFKQDGQMHRTNRRHALMNVGDVSNCTFDVPKDLDTFSVQFDDIVLSNQVQ
jgi:hypothetical protein